ncbi:hypothetical protein QQ045_029602 [Rhodiola kirilowii]
MTISVVESSSVEALAFNYFRFGLFVMVNNIWTLVAVATAAASFYRFKLRPSLSGRHNVRISSLEVAADQSPSTSRPDVNDTEITPPPAAYRTADVSDEGVVRGRRVYSRFYFDDVINNEEELVEEEDEELVMHGIKTVRFDVSERLRLLDLGIYEYQDLRVLDGNVVKLWDSCRVSLSPRATARPAVSAEQMCSKSCIANDYEICLKAYVRKCHLMVIMDTNSSIINLE